MSFRSSTSSITFNYFVLVWHNKLELYEYDTFELYDIALELLELNAARKRRERHEV